MSRASDHRSAVTLEGVKQLARLARLELDDSEASAAQAELDRILHYVQMLGGVEVEGVEPMAHPHDARNRLDPDDAVAGLDRRTVLAAAPAVEGPYIAVPKVLADEGGAA